MTSKKELLQLCKTDLSAQAANHAWNKFNNLINNKVKALHLEGKASSSGSRKRTCKSKPEESNSSPPNKVKKVDSQTEESKTSAASSVQEMDSQTKDKDQLNDSCTETNSQKERQENELKMLDSGFVDKDKAIILALHHLKKKTISDVTIKKLKPTLKTFCIPCMKDSAKENLLSSLGRVLFSRDVITHQNLKTVK